MQLEGKVAFVTGGSSGIGKAAVLAMAREGAKTVIFSRTQAEIDGTVKAVKKIGGEALGIAGDVSSPEDLRSAFAQTKERFGRLDILFANAGINGVWAPLDELKDEEWDETLKINLKGTFMTVKYALPLLKRKGGSIIITSSVNGTRMFSNTGASAYATSKAGQVAFGKMIALELAQDKIRVNIICPGAIESDIHAGTQRRDLDEVQSPVEFAEGVIPLTGGEVPPAIKVAQLVVFLASDAADHISGTEIFVDGAQSLLQG